ncbi:MAG TPA: tetratricopeptide repeat protein [Allosphingosinicella sp.]|nr:tetratricopeptide repeat protein [Allosphingosinicella sp.]
MLSAGGTAAAQQGAASEQRRIFETKAAISDAGTDDEGVFDITLSARSMRFRLATRSDEQKRELWALIEQANDEGRAIVVSYDGSEGSFLQLINIIEYPVCKIAFGERTFEPATPCQTAAVTGHPRGEKALALSFAHGDAGNYAIALDLAERSGSGDDPGFRKLSLYAGANAAEGLATLEEPGSVAADRLGIAALGHYRSIAALDPGDHLVPYKIAAMLEDLGAYAEARSQYEQTVARFPDEEFEIAIRLGALRRLQHDYAQALAELDQLVARQGPQEGMKYFYHRGWTLRLLGRFEEAIAAFTEGMKTQPDFAGSFLQRSCAQAGVGHLDQALADAMEGARLHSAAPAASTDKEIQTSLRYAKSAVATLEQGIAAGGNRPIPNLCANYLGRYEAPRPRSPFLPPA